MRRSRRGWQPVEQCHRGIFQPRQARCKLRTEAQNNPGAPGLFCHRIHAITQERRILQRLLGGTRRAAVYCGQKHRSRRIVASMTHAAANWKSQYPFESREIRLGGYRYHYIDEGGGEVLLLVHGNPTWSFYWRELVRAWSPRYRVVAVDHIGCGLSDMPRGYPYRLAQHVDNLAQFVERLELEEITLVGHDWGGAIGLGAALADQGRYRRFVMFNTAAFRSRRMPWRIAMCRIPLFGRLAVQGLNAFARGAVRMAVCKPERMAPEVRAGILAPYDSWANREAIYRFVADIPTTPRHPSYAKLAKIEAGLARLADYPWLLMWGMRDWCFTPHFLARFCQFFPHAEVHRLADAGHWVVEDAHERVAPVVENFLHAHPLAARGARAPIR
jgi:haloalkane dehalogenase